MKRFITLLAVLFIIPLAVHATVSDTEKPLRIYTSGASTEYPIPFDYIDDEDIIVTLFDPDTATEIPQTKDVDYTIVDDTVTYTTAPGSEFYVIIQRDTPYTQEASFRAGQAPPLSRYESAFDKLTYLNQDLNERVERALLIPGSSLLRDLAFPDPAYNAGKGIRFKNDGTGIEGYEVFEDGLTINIAKVSDYASFSAMMSAVGSTQKTIIVDTAVTMTTHGVIPETMTLDFYRTGCITLGAYNLTFASAESIKANRNKIFNTNASGKVVFGAAKTVYPEWWGTDLSVIVAAIGSTPATLEINSALAVSADLTIPATLQLKINKPGSITVANTKTLTINGSLDAGLYQVFTCTGSGKVVFGGASVKEVNAEWFADLATAVSCIGTTVRDLVITNDVSLAADLSIPATTTVKLAGSSKITIATTKTLTLAGPIVAPLRQIFVCTGTGKVATTVTNYPEWWGALSDGTGASGNSTAIEKIFLSATYGTIHFSRGTYLIARAIQIPSGWSLEGDGRLSSIISRTDTTAETLDAVSTTTVIYIDGTWVGIKDLKIQGTVAAIDGISFDNGGAQSHVNIERVDIAYCKTAVTETIGCFMTTFNNVNVQQCAAGFDFNSTNGKTSLTFNNCYVSTAGQPYDFGNTVYSTMNSCGADWCNWGSITPNASGTGYGDPATAKGIYNFENACSMVLNGCGAESAYGNGVVKVASSFITLNNFTSYSCRSTYVPDYDTYTDYGVGPIQTGLTWCNLVCNGVYNYDWHNTAVDADYPAKPVAGMVAFNYDHATYGAQTFAMVVITVTNLPSADLVDGMGTAATYVKNLFDL